MAGPSGEGHAAWPSRLHGGVVEHERDASTPGVAPLQKRSDPVCPVRRRATLSSCRPPPAGQQPRDERRSTPPVCPPVRTRNQPARALFGGRYWHGTPASIELAAYQRRRPGTSGQTAARRSQRPPPWPSRTPRPPRAGSLNVPSCARRFRSLGVRLTVSWPMGFAVPAQQPVGTVSTATSSSSPQAAMSIASRSAPAPVCSQAALMPPDACGDCPA